MANEYYEGANERLIARVPPGAKRILDVGCAAGRLGEILKSQDSGREVWGMEAVPQVAASAKERLDHVVVGDVEAMDPLPMPERYFDCVICGDVLEHLKDPGKFLARLRKHLSQDAKLLVNVPNIGHWSVIVGLLRGEFTYEDKGLLDRTHLHFFTPSSFKDLLWEAGYVVEYGKPLKLPDGGASKAIGLVAKGLGLDQDKAEDVASTYQYLVVGKPVPDPYTQPDKMAALVGPHVGKLGPATKRCSIVVLTYNSMQTIEECLTSVMSTLSADDELIVVDNSSKDGTQDWLKTFTCGVHGDQGRIMHLILNDKNLGFSAGCNLGILASRGEYVILLNPDTKVFEGWIEGLIARFSEPSVGAVGPLSDNVCGDQFVGLYVSLCGAESSDEIQKRVKRLVEPALAVGRARQTKLLIGFCLALRRTLINEFGALDEMCSLGADDLEMSWRLRVLGYKLIVAENVYVRHHGSVSFASLEPSNKRFLVYLSDGALIDKLVRYYDTDRLPTSFNLWNSAILCDALECYPYERNHPVSNCGEPSN